MKFPLVTRKAFDALAADRDALKKACGGMATEIATLQGNLGSAKDTMAKLRNLCNMLEAKQRDLDEPPISSTDLRDTLRRLSFLEAKCEALEAENRDLRERHLAHMGTSEQGA